MFKMVSRQVFTFAKPKHIDAINHTLKGKNKRLL